MSSGEPSPDQECFELCLSSSTNKGFLCFVTVLLNFIFPYKSYFYVVSDSHMRSDICYLILAEKNETY